MDLGKFVKNKELIIPEEAWDDLNSFCSKQQIKQSISDTIAKLPLPYTDITEGDAKDDFINLLNLDSQSLLTESEWFTRYDYKYSLGNKIIKNSRIGNTSSNYFHQENRWKCDSINAPSPYRTWNTEKFRLTLLNGLWTQKVKRIDNRVLRSCIALRKYIASQFRPSAAKCVYDHFKAKRVLDISSGWGDRLSGFYASKFAEEYVGYDPNENLFKGYDDQIDFYGNIITKDCGIYNEPFEEAGELENDYFDLVFTSPPYFRVERYTKEDNQSWVRYKQLDDWLNKFLFKSLEIAWKSLKKGGYMAINISDVYMNHTVNQICDPMNDYIKKLGGEYIECIGYQLSKRPNSKADRKGIFCEPIWVWRK